MEKKKVSWSELKGEKESKKDKYEWVSEWVGASWQNLLTGRKRHFGGGGGGSWGRRDAVPTWGKRQRGNMNGDPAWHSGRCHLSRSSRGRHTHTHRTQHKTQYNLLICWQKKKNQVATVTCYTFQIPALTFSSVNRSGGQVWAVPWAGWMGWETRWLEFRGVVGLAGLIIPYLKSGEELGRG